MFQFPALAPYLWYYLFKVMGSPIRKSTGQGLFAPHRGLSQLVTSFIASESLGIPRTLLLNFLVSSIRTNTLARKLFNCKRFLLYCYS